MGKVRYIYRNYNATSLKNRSSIPVAGDITVGVTSIDCVNIKASAVKNLIGAAEYSLYKLCRHANLNQWSNFGPTLIDYHDDLVGGTGLISCQLPTICKLGDFAGYNHYAIAPGWPTGELAALQAAKVIQPYGNATFDPTINIGEIEYPSMSHVAMSLWVGGSIVAAELLALSSLQGTASFNLVNNSFYFDTSVTVKFRIIAGFPSVGDYLTAPELYDRFYVPNISDVTTSVKMEIATTLIFKYIHGTIGNDHTFDSLNFSTGNGGIVSWVDAYWETDFFNGLNVTALLSKWNYDTEQWDYIGSSVVYDVANYFAFFPTTAQACSEIWPGNTVTAYGFLYELVIDANV